MSGSHRDYLLCSDIAIDPKNSDAGEGSGKMLNYLAAGLPVIAFDTANNREFLPEQTKLAANEDELAVNLAELTKNQALRKEHSDAARRSWGICLDSLRGPP